MLRSRNDLKRGVTAEDAALGEDSEDDDEDVFEGLLAEGEAMEAYKFGETSGSKLVDRMRKKEEKEKRRASNNALSELASSGKSLDKLAGSSANLSAAESRRVSCADSLFAHADDTPAIVSPRGHMGSDGDDDDNDDEGSDAVVARGLGRAEASTGDVVGLIIDDLDADTASAVGYTSSPWAQRGSTHGSQLSPMAPSMPLPSSPSFQAQSRRPKLATPKSDLEVTEQSTSEPESNSNSNSNSNAAARASAVAAVASTASEFKSMRASHLSEGTDEIRKPVLQKPRGGTPPQKSPPFCLLSPCRFCVSDSPLPPSGANLPTNSTAHLCSRRVLARARQVAETWSRARSRRTGS